MKSRGEREKEGEREWESGRERVEMEAGDEETVVAAKQRQTRRWAKAVAAASIKAGGRGD